MNILISILRLLDESTTIALLCLTLLIFKTVIRISNFTIRWQHSRRTYRSHCHTDIILALPGAASQSEMLRIKEKQFLGRRQTLETPQKSFRLLDLPLEIRLLVYEYSYGHEILQMTIAAKRSSFDTTSSVHVFRIAANSFRITKRGMQEAQISLLLPKTANLMYACKQLYMEAGSVFWKNASLNLTGLYLSDCYRFCCNPYWNANNVLRNLKVLLPHLVTDTGRPTRLLDALHRDRRGTPRHLALDSLTLVWEEIYILRHKGILMSDCSTQVLAQTVFLQYFAVAATLPLARRVVLQCPFGNTPNALADVYKLLIESAEIAKQAAGVPGILTTRIVTSKLHRSGDHSTASVAEADCSRERASYEFTLTRCDEDMNNNFAAISKTLSHFVVHLRATDYSEDICTLGESTIDYATEDDRDLAEGYHDSRATVSNYLNYLNLLQRPGLAHPTATNFTRSKEGDVEERNFISIPT